MGCGGSKEATVNEPVVQHPAEPSPQKPAAASAPVAPAAPLPDAGAPRSASSKNIRSEGSNKNVQPPKEASTNLKPAGSTKNIPSAVSSSNISANPPATVSRGKIVNFDGSENIVVKEIEKFKSKGNLKADENPPQQAKQEAQVTSAPLPPPAAQDAAALPEAENSSERNDFQTAMAELQLMPERMRDEVYRLLGVSDENLSNLIALTRIIRVQCLIRSFTARRRVRKIREAKLSEPSEYAKAMETLEKLPAHMAEEVRRQMNRTDRPLHVIIKWVAVIMAQSLVRSFLVRKRLQKARKQKEAAKALEAGGRVDMVVS